MQVVWMWGKVSTEKEEALLMGRDRGKREIHANCSYFLHTLSWQSCMLLSGGWALWMSRERRDRSVYLEKWWDIVNKPGWKCIGGAKIS